MNPAELHEYFKITSGVKTDSRLIKDDCLFFALKGHNFDGNEFAIEALKKGAKFAVVDRSSIAKKSNKLILVENSLQALQQLAQYHRKKLGTKIIALTGSNGKTTTKELILSVLSQKYNTRGTIGNLNNHIGVPLTLLQLDENTEIGVVEMGANHIGEIDFLSKMIDPNFGLITNFGHAHLEGFGGFRGIIKGKSELFEYLIYKSGTCFLNIDDPLQIKWRNKLNSYTFGQDNDANCQINYIREKFEPLSISFENKTIKSQIYGDYNFSNISTAVAVGRYFKLSFDEIKKGIYSFLPSNNRSQIIIKGSNRITLDAYNANPSSMKASISSFCAEKQKKSVVILGDMLELGKYSVVAHQSVIQQIIDSDIDEILTIGKRFLETKSKDQRLKKFKTITEAEKYISEKSYIDRDFLIKGSRGIALERLKELL
jgi:UDP-N-acetylmuramoyl-tripeptide--D-alanyl-D-alanine ligase